MPTANHKKAPYQDHVIVCSLNRQGRAFITNLRHSDRERQIIALIRQIGEGHAAFCQQHEVTLIEGDARQANGLRSVEAQMAQTLIACSHSVATNLQIAAAVKEVLAERPLEAGQLDLYVAVSAAVLQEGSSNDNFRHLLQPGTHLNPYVYNEETLLARWYFNQYPPHVWADRHGQQQVHLVFAGFSPLVEALMCQYAKISPYKDFAAPVFTLLGEGAEQQRQALVARYPVFANGRSGAEQVISGLYARACDGDCHLDAGQFAAVPITAVLCCSHDDDWNVRCALNLRGQIAQQDIPFYVYAGHSSGVGLADAEGLIPFGMAEQVFDLERLAAVERHARAVHEAYRQQMLAADPEAAAAADSLQPWEQLAETYRAANRRAGDHFAVKLASIGYPLEPGQPLPADDSLTLDEPAQRRELLSRLEHRSWRYERLLNGWRYGEVRDNQQRLHPSIVLWEDLSAAERQKDVSQMENVRRALR